MASVVDVFFRALLDDGQLQVDAKRAGDKMGQTIGTSLSSRLGSALKTGAFTALAAGAAIAGRGLVELSSITADFAAETGASAEEAQRAGKAINEMGGRNLQPLREIGAALTKVHTDLGLTGTEAEKVTEKFLKYGTATKQGAAAAVKDFDDILDAWNLTADHSGEIMDALIVGHQKYGGSIEANQKALAAMAPQLKALNASWQDGIGLLNLFDAAGIDASTTLRALNTAVSKLKPGQTLNDLIAQVSAIEDPTLRAKKAIELFGARGGVALANALRPGITSLDQFETSASDAAGSTERAAGAIENAFPNWVALRIKAIGSAIIGLGQTIGPLGAALTGIISLGGALGFDKLFAKLGPKAAAGLSGLWKSVASSALVTGAISAASDKAATLYLKALIAGDTIGAALAGMWARVIALPVVGAAIASAGSAAAGIFWSAAVAAAAAAPLIVFGAVLKFVNDIGPMSGPNSPENLLARKAAQDAKAAADKAAADGAAQKAWQDAGKVFASRMAAGVEQYGPPTVSKAVTLSVKGAFGSDLAARNSYAKAFGRRLAGTLADSIRDARQNFDDAWDTFLDALKNVETPSKRIARLLGRLASKELAQGLKDNRPEVQARAEEVLQGTIDELGKLVRAGQKIGKDGMESLRLGMKSKNPDIRTAAQSIYNTIHETIPTKADGKTWGTAIGSGLAAGLRSVIGSITTAVNAIATTLANFWKTHSPAKMGPLSLDGGPEGWGQRIVGLLQRGIAAGLPAVQSTLNRGLMLPALPSLAEAVPAMTGYNVGAVGAHGAMGDTYNIDVKIEGKPAAHDPVGVARQLARFSQAGAFKVRR